LPLFGPGIRRQVRQIGKFDRSFNEAAFNGAQRWAEETGGSFREIELQSEAQREQALRRFAEAGNEPGRDGRASAFGHAAGRWAPDYPDTKFVIIDGVVEAPNVRSVIFSEHEGSYLVGMMAAMASETGTVGFVGGMDIPLIRASPAATPRASKAVNPEATVIANMTGTTPAAWNDPVKGRN
jgi:basic membrane protein A